VRDVLGEQRLAQRCAHRHLLTGILASYATQDGDRVMTFPERPIIPPRDGGGAEAHRFACRRMVPLARRQLDEFRSERAFRRRRRQKLPDHRKTQLRPLCESASNREAFQPF
jgi:hypothetical protein